MRSTRKARRNRRGGGDVSLTAAAEVGQAGGLSQLPAVALFSPRIAAHVVAVGFPETGPVFLRQFNAGHPFGTLPGIDSRHDEAGGASMFGRNRLAVVEECHKRVIRQEVL